MELYNGYIAFLKPKTLLDKLICFIDGGKYCHSELVVDKVTDNIYVSYTASARAGGVTVKHSDYTNPRWELVPVKFDRDFAFKWHKEHATNQYDYVGLFTTKFPWIRHHKGKWFCSEACAAMLKSNTAESYGIEKLYKTYVK